jgi:hypothetical protein
MSYVTAVKANFSVAVPVQAVQVVIKNQMLEQEDLFEIFQTVIFY